MTTEKTFTVAGTATQNGVTKARFANDLVARIKILNKAGCTDINLVELPTPMTKLEALQHLQTIGITEGDAGYAVTAKLAEKTKVAKAAEVRVAVKPESMKAKAKTAQAVQA
jgi:expansin (peptidoglycan-binding protein)